MAYEVTVNDPVDVDVAEGTAVEIDYSLPISRINQIVQSMLADLSEADMYQTRMTISEVTELVRKVLNQSTHPGTADDWHNFAVDIARSDLYDLCCDILEKGLELFPKNTDLLADYLQYGISCGKIDQCKSYYKVLSKIPKVRYTWRAYSFSVNWLQYLWERSDSEKELEKLQKEMQELVAAFRRNIPEDEESYRCEADIFKLIHDRKEEERVLRSALEELKIAPKCALRLADMLFDRGDYEDALIQIQRGINDANQTQASVNEGYLYYLLGLAKMAVAMRNGASFDAETAEAIYENFDMALRMDNRVAYRRTMEKKTKVVMSKSNHPVDEKYEQLAYLIQ